MRSTAQGGCSPPFFSGRGESIFSQEKRISRACFVKLRQHLHCLYGTNSPASYLVPSFGFKCRVFTCKNLFVSTSSPSTNVSILAWGMASCLERRLWHLSVSDRLKQQSWGMENLLSEGILHSHHFGSNWFSLYKWSRCFTGCCHKLVQTDSPLLWYTLISVIILSLPVFFIFCCGGFFS